MQNLKSTIQVTLEQPTPATPRIPYPGNLTSAYILHAKNGDVETTLMLLKQIVALLEAGVAEEFSQPFWLGGEKHNIGASIGISLYPRDGDDTDTLLKNADIAMYSVKAAGKGHYNFFKPELYANIKARFAMEQALVQAIELNQFVLHYQPRVNTISCEMISMEALIR